MNESPERRSWGGRAFTAAVAALALSLVFSVSLAFGAAAEGAGNVQGKRVALLTNAAVSPWIAAYNARVVESLGKAGVKVTTLTSPQDAALQSQQIDDAVAQKFNLIIVSLIDEVSAIPALQRAKAAGVPVILAVNGLSPGHDDLYLSLVGHDFFAEGRIAGEEMVKALGAKGGNVAVIQGNPAQSQTKAILQTFKAEIAKAPKIKLVAVEGKTWRPDEAAATARELMLRFGAQGGLQGIFAIIDPQAVQAISVLRSLGEKPGKDVIVVSSACNAAGIAAIRDGSLYASVDLSPAPEGELMAEYALRVLKGETIPKTVYKPAHAITRANVEQYVGPCTY